jgi:hypothetical protein
MPRLADPKVPLKKRLLPPSKTQFAWAIEQRSSDKTYFHTKLVQWAPVSVAKPPVEVSADAVAPAGSPSVAGTAAVTPNAPPKPGSRPVHAPPHLVFRTKVVTRNPR